jgi:hypothetical protein
MLSIKLLVIMNFFLKINEKRIFSQIPTNRMAMLEGASFSFTIGYKTCTWKKKNVD